MNFKWTDEQVLEFAKIISVGPYHDYSGCKNSNDLMKRFKELNPTYKPDTIKLEVVRYFNDLGAERWSVTANGRELDFFLSEKDAFTFYSTYKINLNMDKTRKVLYSETLTIKPKE